MVETASENKIRAGSGDDCIRMMVGWKWRTGGGDWDCVQCTRNRLGNLSKGSNRQGKENRACKQNNANKKL